MELSRKQFFRQGLCSLGESLLRLKEGVREVRESLLEEPPPEELDEAPAEAGAEVEPVPDPTRLAQPDNDLCLAKGFGCFTCLERCPSEAIRLVPGTGIAVEVERCTGCGTCHQLCPIVPKGIGLVSRPSTAMTAKSADAIIPGGKSAC